MKGLSEQLPLRRQTRGRFIVEPILDYVSHGLYRELEHVPRRHRLVNAARGRSATHRDSDQCSSRRGTIADRR